VCVDAGDDCFQHSSNTQWQYSYEWSTDASSAYGWRQQLVAAAGAGSKSMAPPTALMIA